MGNKGLSRRADAMNCLFDLQQEGVEFELTPAGFDAHGRRGTLTPDVQARIVAHFPALTRILKARDWFRERASRNWVARNDKWVWNSRDDPLVAYARERLGGETIDIRPTRTPLEVRMAGRPWAVTREARLDPPESPGAASAQVATFGPAAAEPSTGKTRVLPARRTDKRHGAGKARRDGPGPGAVGPLEASPDRSGPGNRRIAATVGPVPMIGGNMLEDRT